MKKTNNQKQKNKKTIKKSNKKKPWFADCRVVIVIGLFVILACVALGLLMGKNSNAPIALGKERAEATSRPVSVEAKENGRSAAAGDGGAATAGDGSPAVSFSGNSNDVKVSVFNCEKAFIIEGPVVFGECSLGAFARCKQLNGFAEFEEAIGVSATPTEIGIEMATDLIASMMETKAAIDKRDRRRAITCADQTKRAASRLMAYNVPFSDSMKKVLGESAEGPCESAWFRRDYEGMRTYATRIIDACGFPPPIRTLAYKRLAELLEAGCEVYNPSPDELMKLKTYGNEYAYAYLNLFARWGYLHPLSVDPLTHKVRECSYKEFFGFDRELEYRETIRFHKRDQGDGEVASNEISVLALGLWSFRYVDLSVAYTKCAHIHTDPGAKLAVDFDTGMKFDEWEIAGALAKISLKVETDVKKRGWNDDEFMVAKTDAFKFLEADLPEFYYNEEIGKDFKTYCMEPQPVPEPSSAVLFLVGLAGLGLRRKTLA